MNQPPTYPRFSAQQRTGLDTITILREIPDRSAEASLTATAPNPAARTPKTRKPKHPAATTPANLAVIDALRPDPDGTHNTAHTEIAQAVRAVWEDNPHIDLPETPSLAADCGWLITHATTWQQDDFLGTYVDRAARNVHHKLEQLCRVGPRPRYRCPTCDWPMQLQDGDYFLCDGGDHQYPGPVALQLQWRRKPPRTGADIVTMFRDEMGKDLTEPQLRQWRKRGDIPNAGKDDAGRALYLPWDVMRRVMPDVLEALDMQDDTQLQA